MVNGPKAKLKQMAKIINMPKPTDEDGNILSVEEVEQLAEEPYYVPVAIPAGNRIVNCTVACDFDNVDRVAKRDYDRFKTNQYTRMADDKPKRKNGKLTNLKAAQDEKEEEANMDSFNAMVEATYDNAPILLAVMFPKDYKENPVILAHDIPGITQDQDELRKWLEAGSAKAWIFIESVIAAFDPTSALAMSQKAAKMMRNASKEMVKAINEDLPTMETEEETTEEPQSESQENLPLPFPNSHSSTDMEEKSAMTEKDDQSGKAEQSVPSETEQEMERQVKGQAKN
jgi:hypothetical protein